MFEGGELARPELPRPTCRVVLVCGPPGAGKTTYVQKRARPVDIVIDLDLIAAEWGVGRERPSYLVGELLEERNNRLAALAHLPADALAYVVLTAPSHRLRAWWCEQLGVRVSDLVLLVPPRAEIYRRIMNDPERIAVRALHLQLAAKWFKLEAANDPGVMRRGVDAQGNPTDPLHAWNR
jgi:AAA domain